MGDVFEDMRAEAHLTERQYLAGLMVLRDLQAWHGTSGGIVGEVRDKVDVSTRPLLWPPGGPSIAALDYRLNRLRPHERRLMAFLIKHRELARGTLGDFGRMYSGYKTAKTTRAVTVGRIGALLDSLADEYLGPQDELGYPPP
jgi:hypothetical protein